MGKCESLIGFELDLCPREGLFSFSLNFSRHLNSKGLPSPFSVLSFPRPCVCVSLQKKRISVLLSTRLSLLRSSSLSWHTEAEQAFWPGSPGLAPAAMRPEYQSKAPPATHSSFPLVPQPATLLLVLNLPHLVQARIFNRPNFLPKIRPRDHQPPPALVSVEPCTGGPYTAFSLHACFVSE